MADKQILEEQRRLKAAGFYQGPLDGVDGGQTRLAREAFAQNQATTRAAAELAAAETAKAQAGAAAAQAEAEKAKAEAAKAAAANDPARLAAEQAKRDDQAAAELRKQLFDSAVTIGAYGSGVIGGHKAAHAFDEVHAAGIAAKNASLKTAAKQVDPLLQKLDAVKGNSKTAIASRERISARLQGIAQGAEKAGTTRGSRGAGGLAIAAGLLASAIVTRVMADRVENETAKSLLNAIGTGEGVAAATVAAYDLAKRAAPTAVLDAGNLAKIEQASEVAASERSVASVARNASGRVVRAAARFVLPIVAVGAGVIAASSKAKAGGSAGDVAVAGAKSTGDVLSGGGVSFYDQARDAGHSPMRALAEGVVRGVYNTATFGMFEGKLAVPGSRAYLNAAAERKASEASQAPASAQVVPGVRQMRESGRVSFTTLDGRTVTATQKQADAYLSRRR